MNIKEKVYKTLNNIILYIVNTINESSYYIIIIISDRICICYGTDVIMWPFTFSYIQPQVLPVFCHLLMLQTHLWPSPGRDPQTGQTTMTLSYSGSPEMHSLSSTPIATENQKDALCMVFVQGDPINSVSRLSVEIPGKPTANQFLDLWEQVWHVFLFSNFGGSDGKDMFNIFSQWGLVWMYFFKFEIGWIWIQVEVSCISSFIQH